MFRTYVMFCFLVFGCQYQCIDYLERLVSEMTYYVSSGTLTHTHSLIHFVKLSCTWRAITVTHTQTWTQHGTRDPLWWFSDARCASIDWSRITARPCASLRALDTSRTAVTPSTPRRPNSVHCTATAFLSKLSSQIVIEWWSKTINWVTIILYTSITKQ